jgi:hypothetical protein
MQTPDIIKNIGKTIEIIMFRYYIKENITARGKRIGKIIEIIMSTIVI